MLASPLFYDKLMGCTIDLSQLVQVGDAFYSEYWGSSRTPNVGFAYRYAQTPAADPIFYRRELIEGPTRNADLTFDPARILDTALEEIFYVRGTYGPDGKQITRGDHIVVHEEDDPTKPVALTRMQHQVENLRAAWARWKQAEPEIYAIIRKHLS